MDTSPSFIWLEPTNNCNLKCIMCPTGLEKVNIKKGYMDYGLYKKIIDEIKDYASAITLAVSGESLLHPEFFDMVKYASAQGIKVLLNTNATLLSKEKANLLFDSGIAYVSFAFDGFNKEMYEKARVGANFESTLDNILYFLKLRKKHKRKKPYTILSILELGIGACGKEEKETFLKMLDGLIDEVRLREVSTWGSTFKDCNEFSHTRYGGLWPPCSRLWSSICIAWDGGVIPCIYDLNHEYVVGYIKNDKLSDIWNSQRMVHIRKAMIDGTYLNVSPLCDNCIVIGTPPIMGIPSGIRLTLTDAVTNFFGYGFEKIAIYLANKLRGKRFSSITIR